jgi:hypothetical protein
MGNRIFTGIVLLLWGASMSWLVGAKIMPAFLQGNAPRSGVPTVEPVCWSISIGSKRVGQAAYQVVPGAEGTQEIHSRVRLRDVPLARMVPRWTAKLVEHLGTLTVDTRTRTVLDPLGNLASFDTRVSINDLPDTVGISGRLREGKLQLRINYGDNEQRFSYPWNANEQLTSDLTPDPKLIGVTVGQRWQKEIYNPFGGPSGSFELVQAEVTGEHPLYVNSELTNTRVIEFHSMSNVGVSTDDRCRTKLWVAEDGRVLRQEVQLMNVRLRFDRMSDEESLALAGEFLDLAREATLTTPELPQSATEDFADPID